MDVKTYDELFEESQHLYADAKAIVANAAASAEDLSKAKAMVEDAKGLRERSKMLQELESEAGKARPAQGESAPNARGFKGFGNFLEAVYGATFKGVAHPGLSYKAFDDKGEPEIALGRKDLVENVGAAGGFLVPTEYLAELMRVRALMGIVRQRARVIRMTRRSVDIPVLDQTGTTAGQSHYYGGVVPSWTEEAAAKDETEPKFRQITLTAHKLVTYTEASDELLADSAVSLEDLLSGLFVDTILNEAEWAFINGTGAGQPQGIVTAPATIVEPRAAAGAIGLADIFNMVSDFQGQNPIWIAHQSTMPSILGLNGPAGNPSYVWIGNGRDAMPTTLMGYPIYFVENALPLGTQGDLILADWSKYLIGERQGIAVDASKHYRFRYDLTAWRAVYRVDGQPWLSTPITYRDGATQVSPFVVLGDARQS